MAWILAVAAFTAGLIGAGMVVYLWVWTLRRRRLSRFGDDPDWSRDHGRETP